MLERVAPPLGDERVRDLKRRLGKGGEHSVASEWEIAVIYALSLHGAIESIEDRKGNPDLLFTPNGLQEEKVLVEITALSDAGAEEISPLEAFRHETRKFLMREGLLDHGTINCEIGLNAREKKHFAPAIPTRGNFANFFRWPEIQGAMKSIRAKPCEQLEVTIQRDDVSIKLRYSPGKPGLSWQFPNHRTILDLGRNVIVNRLRKKRYQVKRSGENLPTVIVVCDNDCYALSSAVSINPPPATVHDVVDLYLNGGVQKREAGKASSQRTDVTPSRISGVLVLRVNEKPGYRYSLEGNEGSRYRVAQTFVKNMRTAKFPLSEEVIYRIVGAFDSLPPPQELPSNARTHSRIPAKYGGGSTTYQFENRSLVVKLSLGTLQKLLCGEVSTSQFVRDHQGIVEAIQEASKAGRVISKISIEESKDEDDDWVKIEFGKVAPDPLIR